jgi:hypothetical protein
VSVPVAICNALLDQTLSVRVEGDSARKESVTIDICAALEIS